MKRGILLVAVAAAVVIMIFAFSYDFKPKLKESAIFHITLANPDLYENGVFSDSFNAKKGTYQFRFVPNGDSPKTLSINLKGESFNFSEDFILKGTLHETGFSEYYTWDYMGMKEISLEEDQELLVEIDPHGDVLGPVSVDLIMVE